jgi:hypothetical protein
MNRSTAWCLAGGCGILFLVCACAATFILSFTFWRSDGSRVIPDMGGHWTYTEIRDHLNRNGMRLDTRPSRFGGQWYAPPDMLTIEHLPGWDGVGPRILPHGAFHAAGHDSAESAALKSDLLTAQGQSHFVWRTYVLEGRQDTLDRVKQVLP